MNRQERGLRASLAARRRAEKARLAESGETPAPPKKNAFAVLLAVHRPRYRSRAERAVASPEWNVRSLTIKEDPIGMIQQKTPDVFIVSVETDKNKGVGYLRAAQRFREQGLFVLALFESPEEAEAYEGQYDALLVAAKSLAIRAVVAAEYERRRGKPAVFPVPQTAEDGTEAEE